MTLKKHIPDAIRDVLFGQRSCAPKSMGGVSAMALSGPVLVVADDANEVCEALTRGGNLPMREAAPGEALAAITKAKPSAVVLAGCTAEIARPVAAKLARLDGPLVPMLAVVQESDAPAFGNALPIPAA